ncbi:tyrosine phosphatase family-domain-containing protein [Lipomyces tetrasporus]|uniref:diphosphoinositol-polyphosphate diphosphatase n=1 Tax=Lipomyces tetrasporus TaxID=54092 RepID=A0AAD7QKM8_9ASCO|nr:tyrosine phosphatase family-domain-containing protein [Lipomyces tetrasporus]KAJ8097017.1 tyrosine phosphatase family-domain-containing protein [Lipomyces tetrasporus]
MPATTQCSKRGVAAVQFVGDGECIRASVPKSALVKDDEAGGNEDIVNGADEKIGEIVDLTADSLLMTAGATIQHLVPKKTVSTVVSPGYAVPENFSLVAPGIYRSSFPQAENFEYLKTKNLRSILVLVPEQYPEDNVRFMKENNIKFFQVGMSGNKEPFVNVSDETISTALKIAINPANHPILIHCNRGKHRTGCLVGCIRKLQDWSLTMIFDEYRRFAHPKVRPLDQQFIELYDEREVLILGRVFRWLPLRWDRTVYQYHSSSSSNGSGSYGSTSANGYGHAMLPPPPPHQAVPVIDPSFRHYDTAASVVPTARLVNQSVQN